MSNPVLERDFQKAVIDTARIYGWKIAHFRPALTKHGWRTPVMADGQGFPDLTLVRGNELVFAELKSDHGRPTREQRHWVENLNRVQVVKARIWRPTDWNLIIETLERRAA